MTEVQPQPTFQSKAGVGDQTADKDALITRLDELLEQYLHTLDEYQKARDQLSKQLSSGYLSLAQANFQNRSTTHYGQDSYDERMQAIRKIVHGEEDASSGERISCFIASMKDNLADSNEIGSDHLKNERRPKIDTTDAIPEESKKISGGKERVADPLHWFGILVPPALRYAQSSFVAAIEGPVPRLASIARDLRGQEIEIGRVRKQIKKS